MPSQTSSLSRGSSGEESGQEGPFVGIDFGTTNSVLAVASDGKLEVVVDVTPSLVSFSRDGEVVVGRAIEDDDWLAVRSVKRMMGGQGSFGKIDIFGKECHPERVACEVIRHMLLKAEAKLGCKVDTAVVSVPAYYNDAQRSATQFAAQLAGLKKVRFISEPTAAAVCYGSQTELAEGHYAVFDLGGGTLDASIVKNREDVFRVLSTCGDTSLGGDDFDAALALKLGISAQEARLVKETLTRDGESPVITLDEFDECVLDLVHKCVNVFRRALSDAGLVPEDLKGIVLVGGSTRMRIIHEALACEFACPVFDNLDADRVVALGAAIYCEKVFGRRTDGKMLLDITPLSLGIEAGNGIFEKIIPRNTPVPISKTQNFTTYEDGQTGIVIHVLQGEREFAADCFSIGKFVLGGIPPMKAGLARVEVTFSLDIDGVLNVKAREAVTGIEQEVEMSPASSLDSGKVSEILDASAAFAKEDIMARLLEEVVTKARHDIRVLERAISEYGQHLDIPETVDGIKQKIADLKAAITAGLADKTNSVLREKIEECLTALEDASREFMERRFEEILKGKGVGVLDNIK